MALEPVSYRKNSRDIESTYLKVIRSEDPELKWLILSPDSDKEYYVSQTGSNFSDFLKSFQDNCVEFGLCKNSPPGSDVEKIVLIGWCPDSSPMKSRSSFASNFNEISNNVLKSYHVQVTARDEDDLDEREILMRLSNAAGARYSIQDTVVKKVSAPAKKVPSREPVKPSPKPVVEELVKPSPKPVVEEPVKPSPKPVVKETLKPSPKPVVKETVKPSPKPVVKETVKPVSHDDDDDDWNEPVLEERDLLDRPLKRPSTSSWKPIGKIDLQKIIAEEKSKEDPRLVTSSTNKKINPADDIASLKKNSKLQRDQEFNSFLNKPTSNTTDDKPIVTKREEIKTEIKDDVEEQDKQEDINNLKARFEKLNTEPVIIQPKKISTRPSFNNESPSSSSSSSSAATPSPVLASRNNYKKIGIPLPGMHVEDDEEEEKEKKNDDDGWSDDEEDKEPVKPVSSFPSRRTEPVPEPKKQEHKDEESEDEEPAPVLPSRHVSPSPPPPTSSSSAQKPKVESEKEEKEEDEDEEEAAPTLPSRNQIPEPAKKEEKEEHVPAPPTREKTPSPEPQLPPRRAAQAPPPPPPKKVSKPSAVAEYDYAADEDNELTFEEGDKILNIEFVDDDWWLGELASGSKGLFPSNYVTLQ